MGGRGRSRPELDHLAGRPSHRPAVGVCARGRDVDGVARGRRDRRTPLLSRSDRDWHRGGELAVHDHLAGAGNELSGQRPGGRLWRPPRRHRKTAPQSVTFALVLPLAVSVPVAFAVPDTLPSPSPTPSPGLVTSTFNGAINTKNTSRTYGLAMGAGAANASLSFSKCSSLSLQLNDSVGNTIGSASGPSIVALTATVSAGNYNYVVS